MPELLETAKMAMRCNSFRMALLLNDLVCGVAGRAALLLIGLGVSPPLAGAATATFEDLGLSPGSAEDGSGLTPYTTGLAFDEVENWNRFTSGGVPQLRVARQSAD